jgi:hypothetical protein
MCSFVPGGTYAVFSTVVPALKCWAIVDACGLRIAQRFNAGNNLVEHPLFVLQAVFSKHGGEFFFE